MKRALVILTVLAAATTDCGGPPDASVDARVAEDDGLREGDGGPDATAADVAPPDDAMSDGEAFDGGAIDAMDPGAGRDVADVGAPAQDDASIELVVQADHTQDPVRAVQMGLNHRWNHSGFGMWSASGPDPAVVADTQRAGVGLVRYPGGTQANLFRLDHAVGPTRGCQVIASRSRDATGAWGFDAAPEASTPYGPAEHMQFAERAGVATNVMVPFVNNSPSGAADWVEYMNAPVGTNPNGGVAWADVRAAAGHPSPYGITRWEVGNEPYFGNQRYWMDEGSDATALDQYIHGEHARRYTDQPLGAGCDFRTPARSDGSANQVFQIWYPPATNVAVTVNGTAWSRVDRLATASAGDAVFAVDVATGEVSFGDGTHGRIPPAGATLRVSYTLDHAGFPAFAAAMKAVDPRIDVCSAWGQPAFATAMARAGLAYDCVVAHPYTILHTSAASADDLYHQHMAGEEAEAADLRALVDAVQRGSGGRSYVVTTEYGAISGADQPVADFEATQMHAVYMASQMARVLDDGLPWAEGGALTSSGLRAVFGQDGRAWVVSAHALALEAASTMFAGGGSTVAHAVNGNPVVGPASANYAALVTAATRDGRGRVNLWVVNRAIRQALTVRLTTMGFASNGLAHVWTVDSGAGGYAALNDAAHPDAITLDATDVAASASFTYRFAPHSITRIELEPR